MELQCLAEQLAEICAASYLKKHRGEILINSFQVAFLPTGAMGLDIVRDSTLGQIVNRLSGGSLLPYPDQRADYVVPRRYLLDDTWHTELHPDYAKFLKAAMPTSSKEGTSTLIYRSIRRYRGSYL